ncbi:hypothetical protein EWM64_g78 [Hericium alpestre]|uniref:CID domain-containing protein n=1 Tax=Hericium alpestre TaxID=135208 RepID=A0A4Z0AC04_9AGAM|nr:hypothetical protein EWM64_g78 [Hericium alpestre]
MATFSQFHPPAYGQVGYPPSIPTHPSPYQYAASPPAYGADPNIFRRDYSSRLAELTVNSRPIIQNLSMVAQEYSRWADVVVDCIEAHIRRVPPWMKLPAFYLLDAISKNVHEPYALYFASIVSQLFLDTYSQVDQGVRGKMEEMLLTWRTGAPNGRELFGVVPQVAIERGIWGTGNEASSFGAAPGLVSKSQVMSELEFALGQKERALQTNPYDTVAQSHISILQQLRKLVEAGVSQDELTQILAQLRNLVRTTVPAPTAPPKYPTPAPYPARNTYNVPPMMQAGPSYSQPTTAAPSSYVGQPSFASFEQPSLPAPEAPTALPLTTGPAPMPNLSNLFDALLKAGVVSATSTPTGAGASARTTQIEDIKPQIAAGQEEANAYRDAILAQSFKLTSAEISKRRPNIVHFLYERLPTQCKQCGLRFSDTKLGKEKMEQHLDMHFRQNRKANQNVGRGHSRSWFISLEDWVNDVSTDGTGAGPSDSSRPQNVKAAAAAEAAKRDAELREQFVVVPPGDEAKPMACPICKETLKTEFQEDDEEWVWKNAVKVDDRIYHATCHAEALTSTSSLAARLRNEVSGGSRSGTPEASSLRSTPPRSGPVKQESDSPTSKLISLKRKAPNDDPAVAAEGNGSPPLKKLILSSA